VAIREIRLGPGDIHFGGGPTRLRALLGSCVAIALWHPGLRIGGMCHVMMPGSSGDRDKEDSRYVDDALRIFERHMRRNGTGAGDYEGGLIGGGNMFSPRVFADEREIGRLNVDDTLSRLEVMGIRVVARDCGGEGYRNVAFDLWNGELRLSHNAPELRLPT